MKHMILSVLLATLAGCCSHADAVKALDRGIATMNGNIADATLTERAKEISLDSHDVFVLTKYALGEIDKLPKDVAERKAAREAAREAESIDVGGGQ